MAAATPYVGGNSPSRRRLRTRLASTAANLTARVRAGHRRAKDCNGQQCSSVLWRSHDQSAHYETAESDLRERAISIAVVSRVGRYDFPCTIYTFEDGSQAYMPEPGHAVDGMAYTLRSTKSVVHREPDSGTGSSFDTEDAEAEVLDMATSYLRWLRYRYYLTLRCERGECLVPGDDEVPHYLDFLLEAEHTPVDHYHDALISARDSAISSQMSGGQLLFTFQDGSCSRLPSLAEMREMVGDADLDAECDRYFTVDSGEDGTDVYYIENAYLIPVPNVESALLEFRAWAPECWHIRSLKEAKHHVPWFRLWHSGTYNYSRYDEILNQARWKGYKGDPDRLVVQMPGQHPGGRNIWVSLRDVTVYILADGEWKHVDECVCPSSDSEYPEAVVPSHLLPPQRTWLDEVDDWMGRRNAVGMTGAEQTFWTLVWVAPFLIIILGVCMFASS